MLRRKDTLENVIDELRNSYRTVDIRMAIGRETVEHEWQCIFIKIRLTKESLSGVRAMHNEIRNRHRSRDNTRFRLLAECREISHFDSIINEIQNRRITVEGICSKLPTEFQNVLTLEVQKYDSYSTKEEKSGYNQWFVLCSEASNTFSTNGRLEKIVPKEELGIPSHTVNHWFDITLERWNSNFAFLVILLPIYVKRLQIRCYKSKSIAIYDIHKSLLEFCDAQCSENGDTPKTRTLNLKDLVSGKYDTEKEMIQLRLPNNYHSDAPTFIQFEIFCKSIGKVYSDYFECDRPLPKKDMVNPLKRSVIQYARNFDLTRISKLKEINSLEWFIYYLFTPIFSHVIWLGLSEHLAEWRQSFNMDGFANLVDFVIFEDNTILLIECVNQYSSNRTLVGDVEIKKLLHWKDKLSTLGYFAKPILVCGEYYSYNSTLFKNKIDEFKDVYFFFKEDIEKINPETTPTEVLSFSRKYHSN